MRTRRRRARIDRAPFLAARSLACSSASSLFEDVIKTCNRYRRKRQQPGPAQRCFDKRRRFARNDRRKSHARAARLHRDDRRIRQEERDRAAQVAATLRRAERKARAEPAGQRGQPQDRPVTPASVDSPSFETPAAAARQRALMYRIVSACRMRQVPRVYSDVSHRPYLKKGTIPAVSSRSSAFRVSRAPASTRLTRRSRS